MSVAGAESKKVGSANGPVGAACCDVMVSKLLAVSIKVTEKKKECLNWTEMQRSLCQVNDYYKQKTCMRFVYNY